MNVPQICRLDKLKCMVQVHHFDQVSEISMVSDVYMHHTHLHPIKSIVQIDITVCGHTRTAHYDVTCVHNLRVSYNKQCLN
jgi:hypothetical protein